MEKLKNDEIGVEIELPKPDSFLILRKLLLVSVFNQSAITNCFSLRTFFIKPGDITSFTLRLCLSWMAKKTMLRMMTFVGATRSLNWLNNGVCVRF